MHLTDIQHIAIKTKDLEATNRFYTEILGTTLADRPNFDFFGSWLRMGNTMIHSLAGYAAEGRDGRHPRGSAAVDHLAMGAIGFDAVGQKFVDNDLEWRQFAIPSFGLWQLFVKDPSGIIIELNFTAANEPAGSKGPGSDQQYDPRAF
jgi:catechol 2,3-dioxygenase-like lactoylglutathione lyase family enzyme